MEEQLLEAWRTNNRINNLLIDAISADGMKVTLSKRGGRNVVRQFAHLHNVRIYQLERRAKDLADGLEKFATKDEPGKRELKKALKQSAGRIERFFEDVLAGKPKRNCFKKGPVVFLSYLVAHESHHRGNILLTLKECGHQPDKDLRFGIWDWDRI
ncbi:MAG: DinB family protein [Planctomycetota bacterium]|jgi:uncharacterized damage-inducible protein DinB